MSRVIKGPRVTSTVTMRRRSSSPPAIAKSGAGYQRYRTKR
jgi:hypothetical protein